jgi:uroporphyrinogen-III decarboxylase
MVKALLRGQRPFRPLLMPVLFSLGSRLENVPLRDFYSNPTKITNALRQIWNVLKLDGVTCYFDPFLEAEALGCHVIWAPNGSRVLADPVFTDVDALRHKLRSPERVHDGGRVRLASEVLQRLKVMLRDEPALVVAVNGPLTLAKQLIGEDPGAEGLPADLVEYAAEATAAVTKTFAESGADVVLLVENTAARQSQDVRAAWQASMDPIINVARFYEALPVLLWCNASVDIPFTMLDPTWECVPCLLPGNAGSAAVDWVSGQQRNRGLALPLDSFVREGEEGGDSLPAISEIVRQHQPVLVTSSGDIPVGGDLKYLAMLLNTIRSSSSQAA